MADDNYWASARAMCAAVPEGAVVEDDELLLASSGLPVAAFNGVFVKSRLTDPDAAIGRARDWFGERGLPFLLKVREGVDHRVEAASVRAGLQPADPVPGMVLAPIPEMPPPSPDLIVEEAGDDAAFAAAGRLLRESFGMTPELIALLIPAVRGGGFRTFVGYVDGEPVSTSALFAVGDVAGVYNVGTPDAYRRRGFGGALTWAAVAAGKAAGCTAATLQSSEMGRSVYQAMGFCLAATYTQFQG